MKMIDTDEKDFHDFYWKRYDASFWFRVRVWCLFLCMAVVFVGVPVLTGALVWRAWHRTLSPIESTPDLFIQYVGIGLIWINMFVWPFLKEWRSSKTFSGSHSQQPLNAEFLLWLLLPREGREAAIGDTNEKFEMMIERFSSRRAKLWYWGEVARSAWPIVSYLGERFLKWTFLGSVADWVRRI